MSIATHIQTIQQQINTAVINCHRPLGSVELLAVSKGQSIPAIQDAFHCGLVNFGENYWQEMKKKIVALSELSLIWHFIGPIQSNKAAEIAQYCHWVHSVDKEKIAQLLSRNRPAHLPSLNICIQVNLDEEPNKSGVSSHLLPQLVNQISQLPKLKLRGLMALPKPCDHREKQYQSFLRLTHLFQQLNLDLNLNMDTLSMGMSNDFIPAIEAGSTIIRIGQAIFGERK